MYEYLKYPRLKELQQSLMPYVKNCNTGINSVGHLIEDNIEYKKLIEFFNVKEYITRIDMLKILPINSVSKKQAHIDVSDYRYSLNIPVLNYEDSSTIFYKPNSKIIIKKAFPIMSEDKNNIPVNLYQFDITEKSEILGEYPTTTIFCMDTQVPHYIHNPSLDFRYSLLVRLNTKFKMELATGFEPA